MNTSIIIFKVNFAIYHYNSGDGKNGIYLHEEVFYTLAQAKEFYSKLQNLLESKDTETFCNKYCWSGYLHSIQGIYKITKEKIQ